MTKSRWNMFLTLKPPLGRCFRKNKTIAHSLHLFPPGLYKGNKKTKQAVAILHQTKITTFIFKV